MAQTAVRRQTASAAPTPDELEGVPPETDKTAKAAVMASDIAGSLASISCNARCDGPKRLPRLRPKKIPQPVLKGIQFHSGSGNDKIHAPVVPYRLIRS